MLKRWLIGMLGAALLAACATSVPVPTTPIQGENKLPPLPALSADDMVRLAGEGVAPEGIVARLKESRTRMRLSASDVLSLSARGVPTAVIDHLLDADRQAITDLCTERMRLREQELLQDLRRAEALFWQRGVPSCAPWGYPFHWRR